MNNAYMENDNKNIKIREILLIIIIITSIIALAVKIVQPSHAKTDYTREELEDIVVSTALSYLHNKSYSDYDQHAMDNESTYNWRQFTYSPEMVNRNNYYYIDCSSFAASVYLHSLGYDFSEYYDVVSNSYYENFTKYKVNSKERFRKFYTTYGKGLSTKYYSLIASEIAAEELNLSSMTAGKEYINNNNTNTNIVAYFYKVSGSESSSKKTTIRNNIKNTLKPGDILVYRNKSTSGSLAGHAMVYVGDEIDSSKGIVHSTGTSYNFDASPVTIGSDSFSVRYEGIDRRIKDYIFINSSSKTSYSFTILRPINKFCIKDSCSVPACTSTTCKASDTGNMNQNVLARKELAKLRVDQYTRINKTYNDNLTTNTTETKTTKKNIGKYNSVNQGDTIEYRVYLENKSKIDFCTGNGSYTTETSCENAGYTWKTSDKDAITYNNLTISGVVPDNTEFVSCNWENYCSYNKSTRKVTWNFPSITTSATISYSVKVTGNKDLVNEGMNITTETGNILQLAPMKTKVNPTMNGINIDLMNEKIEQFSNLVDKNKIKYDSSSSKYKVDYSTITSANISQPGFVRSLYYNTLGMDIGYATNTTIKNAIFDKDGSDYVKKTESEVSSLTDETSININKMLVKGLYGGRYLRSNDNGDRANYIRIADLEYGDIIVYFYTSSEVAQYISMFMYLGLDSEGEAQMVRFESDSGITIYNSSSASTHGKTGWKMLKEIYSKDLFVILRPTQLYGTTVKLNYNEATTTGDNSYVAYQKYRNLNTPKKDGYTITFNYIKNVDASYPTSITTTNQFNGWYSDTNLTNKVTNDTNLISTSTHTLNAKWEANKITLPSPTIEGYSIEGWYSDANLTQKIGEPNETYYPTSNKTLYAKWTGKEYQISYDANGGTGTMENSTHTYNETKSLNENKYTKEGYKFIGWSNSKTGTVKYQDKDVVLNLSEGNNQIITLYAVWEPITYQINYDANSGTGTMSNSEHTYNETKTLNENKYTKEGYNFIGWSKTKTGGVNYSDKSAVLNLTTKDEEVITLYAVWKEIDTDDYLVKVSIENGIVNEIAKYAEENGTIEFTIIPNKGYGTPNASCTNEQKSTIEGNTLKIENITSNTTCTVTYIANEYQIKYNANGGTGEMENSVHQYNVSKNLTKNSFTRNGYNFEGWSSIQNGIKKYIDEEAVRNLTSENNSVVTLYAVWTPITYKIKYNLNGGTAINKETYTIETPTFKLNNPTKEGYNFIGWTTTSESEKKVEVEITTGTTGDKEYTANYEAGKYNVIYKSDDNGSITGKTEEEIEYPNNPTGTTQEAKEGYMNLKWAVDKDVKLSDGTVVYKGESISEEQIKKIIVKEDITITIYHYKTKYSINYESDSNGKIEGSTSEEVAENSNPLGVKITPSNGYFLAYYIANKDVVLSTGETVNAGNEITEENLYKIIVKENITLKAVYKMEKYTVNYESDENGKIIGILKEEVQYQENPIGTKVKANENYKISHWIANEDVKLNTGKEIKKGDKITSEELKEIKVENNLILTAKYFKYFHMVYYKSEENINIIGILKEKVKDLENPTGTKIKAKDINAKIIWIANKAIELENGTIIKKGEDISEEQIKEIIVKSDLILTAYMENNVKVEVPNTNNNKSIILILIGTTFTIFGGYAIYKKQQNNKKCRK